MGFEVIYNLDFYILLHYFPGSRPVASNQIVSKDMSYFMSTVFKLFQLPLMGHVPSFEHLSPLHPFLCCFYQTHTFMLPSWLGKACESATRLILFSGPDPWLRFLGHSSCTPTQLLPGSSLPPLTSMLRYTSTCARTLSLALGCAQ